MGKLSWLTTISRGMRPNSPNQLLCLGPKPLEWIPPRIRVSRVVAHVLEEDEPHGKERDQGPLGNLDPFVPCWSNGFELCAALPLALESELLSLCESGEIRRPLLFGLVAVSREVEGRERIRRRAPEHAPDDLQHHAVGDLRVKGGWRRRTSRLKTTFAVPHSCVSWPLPFSPLTSATSSPPKTPARHSPITRTTPRTWNTDPLKDLSFTATGRPCAMVEALSSNVVNYLVWRYLQEAGYGSAALQLSRCWIRDPEALPFSKSVSPHTLVSLLQDGLYLDKLQAEAGGEQQYSFGHDHGQPYSARNGEMLTLDEGIPAYILAEEATANGIVAPEPERRKGPGKRKKKANGIEARLHTQINGDTMEIDHNGSTHVTNSVRAESEAVASDAESPTVADIPISTLSIGQSIEIQTEKVADLASHTSFIPISDTDKSVKQTLWGGPDAPLLLAAGRSLLRLHLIPPRGTENALNTFDLPLPLTNFSVTAVCWNSDQDMTVSAQTELVNEGGETMKIDKLFRITEGGQRCDVITSTAGFVTTLRWNESSKLLLSISTDGSKGYIKIWKEQNENVPTWTAITETVIYDAVWISDSTFVVCGAELFQTYGIANGLTVRSALETRATWEAVKYESWSGIIAAMATDPGTSLLGIVHPKNPSELQTSEYPDPYLYALDFQPRPNTDPYTPESPILLATCATSGVTRVWDANQPFKRVKRLPTIDDSQAHSVAFSPDGALLAAAGPDAVTVWELDKSEVPIATWRAVDQEVNKWDPTVDGEFSLGWDPDDKSRLSIALGNQIAIVNVPR
ncbi:WD40 repeat-like protein [Lojkania enalia]|uniref:WD40 repeat-like protein n=1 Tax=Lojkania enalia TaxID=147567 RepID=A0A9P4N342_9PLEO|nr:WD40 repeat-like protein [Didymosphaeria enalia]